MNGLSPLASLTTLVIPSSWSWDGTHHTQERDSKDVPHYAGVFVILSPFYFLYLDSSGPSPWALASPVLFIEWFPGSNSFSIIFLQYQDHLFGLPTTSTLGLMYWTSVWNTLTHAGTLNSSYRLWLVVLDSSLAMVLSYSLLIPISSL